MRTLRRYTILAIGAGYMAATWSVAEPARAQPPRTQPPRTVSWRECLTQPTSWYASDEARRIAENVLAYQRDSGGWPKNIDMAAPLSPEDRQAIQQQRNQPDATIDNGATHTQLRFLARVVQQTADQRCREAFLEGFDYLIAAQYPGGGWPQCYPQPRGYARHITFNDDAMVGVLNLLRDITRYEASFRFVDAERRERAAEAVERGTECILRCQVIVDGQRTAWCAQHDHETELPAPARSYELVSLSGHESVGIVRYLMGIENPPPEVLAAVQGAVAWFDQVQLRGIRVERQAAGDLPGGFDRVVVRDEAAPPLWARFYEIGSNRPIFSGRDGIVRRELAEIEHERRTGYAWYVSSPRRLLQDEYPAWRARWLP